MGMGRLYRLGFMAVLAGGAIWFAGSRGGQAAWFLSWLLTGIALSSLLVFMFNLMQVRVARTVSAELLPAGEGLMVELTVRHLSLLPVLWLSVSDRFVREDGGEMFTVTKLAFPGLRRQFKIKYHTHGLKRGEYRFIGTELVAGDWWGLSVKRRLALSNGSFTVLPEPRAMLASVLPVGTGGEETNGAYHFKASSPGHSVRDYAHGDPLHRIHWRSTARTGNLMTRIMEPAEDIRYMVCLNADREAYKGAAGRQLFEQGIEWAAGFMQAAAEARSHAGLAASNHAGMWLAPSLATGSARAILLLAGLAADGQQAFGELLQGRIRDQIPEAYAVVAITPVLNRELLNAVCKLLDGGRQVLLYHVTGERELSPLEREQKGRLERAGCQVLTVRESRMERVVRLDAEYEGA
ncbi:MAG: hypothetical protein K0R57_3840 [Paenibacillaceae bacterium]|jgi:uncharacterized protein (DUF58 family)|nr:hypothetical protein [Paenibacillaceae bacterium]